MPLVVKQNLKNPGSASPSPPPPTSKPLQDVAAPLFWPTPSPIFPLTIVHFFTIFMLLFLPFPFLLFAQMRYFIFISQSLSIFSSYRWDLQYKLIEDVDQPSMFILITSMFRTCWLSFPDSILGIFPPCPEFYLPLMEALNLQYFVERSTGNVLKVARVPLFFPVYGMIIFLTYLYYLSKFIGWLARGCFG